MTSFFTTIFMPESMQTNLWQLNRCKQPTTEGYLQRSNDKHKKKIKNKKYSESPEKKERNLKKGEGDSCYRLDLSDTNRPLSRYTIRVSTFALGSGSRDWCFCFILKLTSVSRIVQDSIISGSFMLPMGAR